MKKLIALLLVLALGIGLVACGGTTPPLQLSLLALSPLALSPLPLSPLLRRPSTF